MHPAAAAFFLDMRFPDLGLSYRERHIKFVKHVGRVFYDDPTDVIWGDVKMLDNDSAPELMTQAQAEGYCRGIGARLPNKAEIESLRKSINVYEHRDALPHLVFHAPHDGTHWFQDWAGSDMYPFSAIWSGSAASEDHHQAQGDALIYTENYLYGPRLGVLPEHSDTKNAVRCVMEAPPLPVDEMETN